MANTLGPGESLRVGDTLITKNGEFRLTLQTDGNLVLYWIPQNTPTWASVITCHKRVTHAIMQTDGNFVIYDGNAPLWATNTSNQPGASLVLQDDGNLVIYDVQNRTLWATNTFTPS
jgi:hypothetical protein